MVLGEDKAPVRYLRPPRGSTGALGSQSASGAHPQHLASGDLVGGPADEGGAPSGLLCGRGSWTLPLLPLPPNPMQRPLGRDTLPPDSSPRGVKGEGHPCGKATVPWLDTLGHRHVGDFSLLPDASLLGGGLWKAGLQ